MADILSTYYKSRYSIKDSAYNKTKFFTPNRIVKMNPDQTFKNLSPYGFYLSENNFILLPKKKLLPRLSIYSPEVIYGKIGSLTEYKETNKNVKKLIDKNILNNSQKKSGENNSLNNQNNKTDENINDSKMSKIKNLKLKSKSININDINDNNIKIINSNKKGKKNKPYINKLVNNRYLYTEDKKEKIENEKKAEQITNELLSLKTIKEIKNYYIKKDAETPKSTELDFNKILSEDNQVINPMTKIKYNLLTNPKNPELFRSFDTQLIIMGDEKYRNNLLDGVNDYKNNVARYGELKGPTGFDKNQIEEKKRNKIIRVMKRNFVEKRGMIFTQQTFKPKIKGKKKIFDFEYDENYKKVKQLYNKDINKYERHVNKRDSLKKYMAIDKKDLKVISNLDDDALLTIKGIDDMVKFSNKFLSFDEKLNKLVSKTINTTGYLFKRTKEYQKIKNKIDHFYNINEN